MLCAVLSRQVYGSLPFPADVMRLMLTTNNEGSHLPRGSWFVLKIYRGFLIPSRQSLQWSEREPVDSTRAQSRQGRLVLWGAVSLVSGKTVAGVFRTEIHHYPVAADLGYDRGCSNR